MPLLPSSVTRPPGVCTVTSMRERVLTLKTRTRVVPSVTVAWVPSTVYDCVSRVVGGFRQTYPRVRVKVFGASANRRAGRSLAPAAQQLYDAFAAVARAPGQAA